MKDAAPEQGGISRREDNMISIFNRKELLITWNLKELAQIRDVLVCNQIDYTVRTKNLARMSPRSTGARGTTGTVGLRRDAMYQYHIYVSKKDYERARFLIGR